MVLKDMNKKRFLIIVFLLVLNLLVMSFLFAADDWVVKIGNEKVSIKKFNNAYKAVVYFRVLSSPIPISDKQINKVLGHNKGKKLYLENLIDEYLIVADAKEKKLFDESKINEQVKVISKYIKRQLIIKEFIKKYIYPKIKQKLKAQKAVKKLKRYLAKLRMNAVIIKNKRLDFLSLID